MPDARFVVPLSNMVGAKPLRSTQRADGQRARYTELQSLREIDEADGDLEDAQDDPESRQLLSDHSGLDPMESDATVLYSRRPSAASTTLQCVRTYPGQWFEFSRAIG